MHNCIVEMESGSSPLAGCSFGVDQGLAYYRNGEKTIPRHIWLACVGWETLHKCSEAG